MASRFSSENPRARARSGGLASRAGDDPFHDDRLPRILLHSVHGAAKSYYTRLLI